MCCNLGLVRQCEILFNYLFYEEKINKEISNDLNGNKIILMGTSKIIIGFILKLHCKVKKNYKMLITNKFILNDFFGQNRKTHKMLQAFDNFCYFI